MPRSVSLFTGQWADLPLDVVAQKAASFGYDGLELGCWGDHFVPKRAAEDDRYCTELWEILQRHGLVAYAVSNHLAGQAVCDPVDGRHRTILTDEIWGDGTPDGVRARAAEEMVATGRGLRRLYDNAPDHAKALMTRTGRPVVIGFTGSPIWHLAYAFPPLPPGTIDDGYASVGAAWKPILDDYAAHDVSFALEVHPTETAFDLPSSRRTLAAMGDHPNFGFNFDPSHFGYQGVDYLAFLREFGARVWHVHIKDAWWSDRLEAAGVFGGHTDFGADGRYWDFRSPGRGRIDFESIIRLLNHVRYKGPLSVEWEDPMMDREHGATEAAAFVRSLDFPQSDRAFDQAFAEAT
jgi:sugar phosphate isomerase/epimerase